MSEETASGLHDQDLILDINTIFGLATTSEIGRGPPSASLVLFVFGSRHNRPFAVS